MKTPKPNTTKKAPTALDNHTAIEDWIRRVMPDLHPVVKQLREGEDLGGCAGTLDTQMD